MPRQSPISSHEKRRTVRESANEEGIFDRIQRSLNKVEGSILEDEIKRRVRRGSVRVRAEAREVLARIEEARRRQQRGVHVRRDCGSDLRY